MIFKVRQGKLLLGFTVAELLVALVALGVVATFTLPKLLNANQTQQKKAILKEDYTIISQAIHEMYQEGYPATQTYSNTLLRFVKNINYTKYCPSSGYAEGCRDNILPYSWHTYPSVVLPNGSVLMLTVGGPLFTIGIDYNGNDGPNRYTGTYADSDITFFMGNFSSVQQSHPYTSGYYLLPGRVQPWDSGYTAVYLDIFGQ
jgi:type II secretory pathway pseudopilin PulG